MAFNVAGRNPFDLAEALNDVGVESRAGCHCATLAHRDLGLDPAASCRLSFYLYNSIDDVDQAVAAVLYVSDTATVALNSTRPSMDSHRPFRVWTLFATATWV